MPASCSECGGPVERIDAATCLRCGRPLQAPIACNGIVPRALFALLSRVLFYVAVAIIGFSAFAAITSALLGARAH
jgi:hypothetical protein